MSSQSRTEKQKSGRVIFPNLPEGRSLINFYAEVPLRYVFMHGSLQMIKTGKKYAFCIVNDRSAQAVSRAVLYYEHWISREILAALIRPEKEGIANINGTELKVIGGTFSSSLLNKAGTIIKKIEIRQNGGYAQYGSRDANGNEIVDVLMYSPFTKRYEITKASYDEKNHTYYMDIARFRRFIYEFGNPGIKIWVDTSNRKSNSRFVNEESLLHAYGYNVNQVSALTTTERHQILTDIVDLELMTVKDIVKLLTYNINLHSQEKYYIARQKWKEDIAFISDYKINPDRFIIART